MAGTLRRLLMRLLSKMTQPSSSTGALCSVLASTSAATNATSRRGCASASRRRELTMDREYIIRLGVALALAAACRTGTQPSAPTAALVPPAPAGYDPARDLGPLFQDVQLSHVFPAS